MTDKIKISEVLEQKAKESHETIFRVGVRVIMFDDKKNDVADINKKNCKNT